MKNFTKKALWKVDSKKNLADNGLSYLLISYYHNVYNATFSKAPDGLEKEYVNFIKRVSSVMDSLTKTDMVNRVAVKELLTKYGYTSEDEIGKNHKYNRFVTKRFYQALTVPFFKLQLLTDRATDSLIIDSKEKAIRRIEIYKVFDIKKKGLLLNVTHNENRWFKPVNIKDIKVNDYIIFDRFKPLERVEICSNLKEAKKIANKMVNKLVRKIDSNKALNNPVALDCENKIYEKVSIKKLKNTFGLTNVVFKSTINKESRHNILNNLYEALDDLTNVLNIKKENVALNKKLIISIDKSIPKFNGISACAVCLPDEHTIALDKKTGAGNFTHEWFHLLDAYLYSYFKIEGGDGFLSSNNKDVKKYMPELYSLLKSIKYRSDGKKTLFYENSLIKDKSELIMFDDDSNYWSDNIELLARTFAIFVKDKLNKKSPLLIRERESNNIEPHFSTQEKIVVYKKMNVFIKKCKKLEII